MAGLKIQVNGSGLIPRGYGIAPRKEPFMANDIYFINLILNTKGLTVKFLNPETNSLQDVDRKNLKKIWDKYANYVPGSSSDSIASQPKFDPSEWSQVTQNALAQRPLSEMHQPAEEAVEPSDVNTSAIDTDGEFKAVLVDMNNPHQVNKSNVGLSDVDDTSVETTDDAPPAKNNGENNQHKNGKNRR